MFFSVIDDDYNEMNKFKIDFSKYFQNQNVFSKPTDYETDYNSLQLYFIIHFSISKTNELL